MPYFVYRITTQPLRLEHLDTFTRYQDARALVRARRQATDAPPGSDYRLIFAAQQAEAERLLSTPRDERVIGED
ncbi:hypothetical protein [Marichromatium bheemlicum]|uniref:Uncharacterized protein n=1 Tax=Marichromatium bheemlicum TaxID=365339 RepID=A0ABX1I6E7_9GAMM|nr:hypothetical protein [Marichromatium bheemlicum]NKN32524.1 hypothetical protein [Marichromatium bheemlicum]